MTKHVAEPKPVGPTAPAAPPPSPPSVLERWLGFAPMLVLIAFFVLVVPRVRVLAEPMEKMRIMPPAITEFAFAICEHLAALYMVWMPVAFAISWAYFTFFAKNRTRTLWFSLAATFLLVLSLTVILEGTVLPFMKIQEVLRKK